MLLALALMVDLFSCWHSETDNDLNQGNESKYILYKISYRLQLVFCSLLIMNIICYAMLVS